MKRNERVEDFLERALPSAPNDEMESALERIAKRLQSDDALPVLHIEDLPSTHHFRPRWVPAIAGVAALLAIAIWIGVSWKNPGVSARLETANGSLSRISKGEVIALRTGEGIKTGDIVRSGDAGGVISLADTSRIEMRAGSELWQEVTNDGVRIHLNTGSIIVNAAKQRTGHLYVVTKDVTVSVVGTVFFVNAEEEGSRVAVIQGEVHVQQGATEKKLFPGEQAASNPLMASRPVSEQISWSSHVEEHMALLQQTTAVVVPAPSTDIPKWEAVAIKPCNAESMAPAGPGAKGGGDSRSFNVSPGRLTVECMNVDDLIRIAYIRNGEPLLNSEGINRSEWTKGGPEWVHSLKFPDRYRIDAKAEGDPPDRKVILGPMLQQLLENRFRLKIHRDTEEGPSYALVAANGGLKIKPRVEGDCDPSGTGPRGPELLDAVRRGVKGPCEGGGLYGEPVGPTTMGYVFAQHTMANFANTLSSMTHRKVIDQTEVRGGFRFYLEYTPDNIECALSSASCPPGIEVNLTAGTRGPDIFAAIQEQLGLKLVNGPKVQRQFIVIDHAERPTEN